MSDDLEPTSEETDLRLSPKQEREVRRRLAEPKPLVPAEEMRAFFRKLIA